MPHAAGAASGLTEPATLCVIAGDGIGPEVVPVAVEVLAKLLPALQVTEAEAGWDCFQRHGCAVPEATLASMHDCGAGLFGAVSSPSRQVAGYRSAILMVQSPQAFDLIVTSNLFGDILSDLACHWSGGLGLAPSLNWGSGLALAEPVHGSAPDIAGSGRANPLAAILSAALLLRYHWRQPLLAERLEQAVHDFLEQEGRIDFGHETTRVIGQGVLARL